MSKCKTILEKWRNYGLTYQNESQCLETRMDVYHAWVNDIRLVKMQCVCKNAFKNLKCNVFDTMS